MVKSFYSGKSSKNCFEFFHFFISVLPNTMGEKVPRFVFICGLLRGQISVAFWLLKVDDKWYLILLDYSECLRCGRGRNDYLRFRVKLNCFFSETPVFNYEVSKLTYIYYTVKPCISSSLSCSNCF